MIVAVAEDKRCEGHASESHDTSLNHAVMRDGWMRKMERDYKNSQEPLDIYRKDDDVKAMVLRRKLEGVYGRDDFVPMSG